MSSSLENTKKILLACEVNSDGVGDFYHLLDVLKNKDRFMENYKKDVFITTSHSDELNEHFKDCLQELGFEITFVDLPSSMEVAVKHGNADKNKALILNYETSHKYDRTKTLEFFGNYYAGIIDVSMEIFSSFYKKIKIPRIFIAEHGKIESSKSADLFLPMDLLTGTQSIFLTKEDREKPEKQLAEVLSKSENTEACKALLETTSRDPSIIQTKCDKLLKESLFVPAYIQHSNYALVNHINTLSNASLSEKFESIVFFINKKGVDIEIIKTVAHKGFLSKNVKEIIIKTKDGDEIISNPNADSKAKTIKLAVGYRIPDDNDYKKLFHCAQFFAGCSGDKSLELVLSNGLIPLFVPHNDDKKAFIENCCKFDPKFKVIKYIYSYNTLFSTALSETDAAAIKKTFFPHFSSIEEKLGKLEIDAKYYPDSVKELQKIKKPNWVDYSLSDQVQDPDQNKFVDYFIEHDFLELMKSEIQRRTDKVTVFLNQNFYKLWREMCDKLKKDYNLHDKLPGIINKFFKEHGLEVSVDNTESKKTQSKLKS